MVAECAQRQHDGRFGSRDRRCRRAHAEDLYGRCWCSAGQDRNRHRRPQTQLPRPPRNPIATSLISIHGTYCRGGPLWPPVVLVKIHEATVSDFVNMIKATGGHGGPPLQYVRIAPITRNRQVHLIVREGESVAEVERFASFGGPEDYLLRILTF